jgi:hypothetical protein
MTEAVKIYANRRRFSQFVELLVFRTLSDGRRQSLDVVRWTDVGEGDLATPTCGLDESDAQALIDELWACGLRPTEGTGSAGSLAATERHLKDMRDIAMGALKKAEVLP